MKVKTQSNLLVLRWFIWDAMLRRMVRLHRSLADSLGRIKHETWTCMQSAQI
jgi:hypothetical protein